MGKIKPYSLKQAQAMVNDAVRRSETRHSMWRAIEHLFRTGDARKSITAAEVSPRLWEDLPGLTLDGINMVLPHVTIIEASVLNQDPGFVVEPYTGGEPAEERAAAAERLLRYFWKRVRATPKAKDAARNAIRIGNGFLKIGWAHLEEEVDRDEVDALEDLVTMLEQDRRLAILEDRDPTPADVLADRVSLTEALVLLDEPYVEYVSPYDIFVPTNARRMEETRWVAQRIILPMDEVQANDEYDQSARDQLVTTFRQDRAEKRDDVQEAGWEAGDSGDDNPFAEATIFEFYDMRTHRMIVFQDSAEDALYDEEIPWSHRHPPYVHMRNLEDGGERFWAFGHIENVAAVQRELNEYVEKQMEHMRRAGNKYAVDEKHWTEDLKALLESDQDGEARPVRLNGRNINDIVQALERRPFDADVYGTKEELLQRMRDILGINDFMAGGSGADRMSATAAAAVDGVATLRASDPKQNVEEGISRAGLQLLLLCQEFLDSEVAVRFARDDGFIEWFNVTREDLIGEFEVSVEAGSTSPVNPATRRQNAVDLLTQVIPVLLDLGYDVDPLVRKAIRDYGLDPETFLKRAQQPPPAPEQPAVDPAAAGQPAPFPVDPALGGPPVPAGLGGDINL